MPAPKKTLDRELQELNEELRVIIPGVQIQPKPGEVHDHVERGCHDEQ